MRSTCAGILGLLRATARSHQQCNGRRLPPYTRDSSALRNSGFQNCPYNLYIMYVSFISQIRRFPRFVRPCLPGDWARSSQVLSGCLNKKFGRRSTPAAGKTRKVRRGSDLGMRVEKYIADRLPLYMQVAMKLDSAIRSKQLTVGTLLPPEVKLSDQYGVSRATIRQAIGYLRERGILSTRRPVGTRVEASSSSLPSIAPQIAVHSKSSGTRKVHGLVDAVLSTEVGSRREQDWVHLQSLHLSTEKAGSSMWMDIYVEKPEEARAPVVHLLLKTSS